MAAFRIHLAGHPLLLTLALLAVLWLAERIVRAIAGRELAWSAIARALCILSLAALTTYAGVVVYYAADPHYFDAAEPTVTAVGWLFHIGQPIHHAVNSAERYAHIYGPMTYIAHGLALGAFGPGIVVSKWVGGSAALVSLALIFAAVRTHVSVARALVLAGLCALLMLAFRNYSFWTRPEPLMVFCMAAGLVAAVRGRGYGAAAALGIFAGLLWNLKATGPLYSLPLFVLLYRRLDWQHTLTSAGVALVTAVLPFLVFSNVSFANYVAWFRLSAGNGLTWPLFTRNLQWGIYVLLPLLLAARAMPSIRRSSSPDLAAVYWALVVTVCGVVVAGSKPGAGPYHLLPLLSVIAVLVAERIGADEPQPNASASRLTVVSFVTVAAAIALVQQVQFIETMQGRRSLTEIQDIQAFVDQHAGVVEMGYAVDDPITFERPVLVFRNNAYLIDAPAVGEHQLAGLPIPTATIDALRNCRVNYWLIPKGEEPFTARNMYAAVFQQPLFSEEFRRVFLERHTRIATTRYFDAWECHGRP